jgi:hypothetical protein
MDEKKPKKIAVVTYNRVGNGQYPNGRVSGRNTEVYLAQNGHRTKWAAQPYSEADPRTRRAAAAMDVIAQVDLEQMDHVYLYVGTGGGEKAIWETGNLPAKNVTYVMCDCNTWAKRDLIERVGNADAKVIWCECGGRHTLDRIVKGLLEE